MQYKLLLAFAMGAIKNKDRFLPLLDSEGHVQWAQDRIGLFTVDMRRPHKLSIVGALRYAQESLSLPRRAYNKADQQVRMRARALYEKDLQDLDHQECMAVLFALIHA